MASILLFFFCFFSFGIKELYGQTPEISAAIPSTIFSQALNNWVIPNLNNEIKTLSLPTTCCYDHVESSLVHLNFQNIKEVATQSGVAGVISSTPSGLVVAISGQFLMTFFYRLCIHINPFNKHSCDTLDGCKGNGYWYFVGNGGFNVGVANNPSNGQILLTPFNENFKSSIPKHNVCNKIEGAVVGQLGTLDNEVIADLKKQVPPILAEFENLNQHMDVSNEFSVSWFLLPGTRTTSGGAILNSKLSVYAKSFNNKVGPFQPRYPLPDVSKYLNPSVPTGFIALSDSIFSNIIWSYYVTVANPSFNISFLGDHLVLKFVNSPEVQFSSSGTTVVLSGNFNWANNTALFNGAFIQNLNADVSVVADKNITLKLSAGSLNVKIINSSGISITPAQVAQAMTSELALLLPLVNSVIHPMPIPAVPHLKGSNIKLSYGNGYVLVQENINLVEQFNTELFSGLFQDLPWLNASSIACPDIPKARHSGCI